jgi:hypothetical protein
MQSNADFLKAYEAFLEQFSKDTSWKKDLLDFDSYKIRNIKGADPPWFIYHMHSLDFTRALIFSINRFRYYIAQLSIWCKMLPAYSDMDKLDLLIDFIYPISIISIDYPYKIKNRIIYSACYLCNSSNYLLKSKRPNIQLPEDKLINYKVLQAIGIGWKSYDTLKNALNRMNHDQFREKTDDFRNAEHHRIPPAIEIGQSRFIRRISSEKGRQTYSFGGPPPIPLSVLVCLLMDEHQYSKRSFHALWLLMKEQREHFIAT